MTKEEGYKETKTCQCICCGKDVTVTKFASASKVMCDECKKSGVKPTADIIISAPKLAEPRAKYEGATKILPCTKCGKPVEVTKFASAAKVLCDECKGESGGYAQHDDIVLKPIIHMDKLDRNVVPTLEEYHTTPALINNRALRNVKCPACGHEYMKILRVMDWSTFGLIVHYQCPKCKLLVSVSEQTTELLHNYTDGTIYDYSGNAITSDMSALQSSRASTAIRKLMGILQEHNIEIEGDELPPYIYDEQRPAPVGFRIPRGDREIKSVADAISMLKTMQSRCIEPDDVDYNSVSSIIDGLTKLFDEGDDND